MVKAVRCGEPITLGTCYKQGIHVCDITGHKTLGLDGSGYQLMNFCIIKYEDVKYLAAMCWDESKIK